MAPLLALALALAACSRDAAAPAPIATINAVIGDASFVAAFGRIPTPIDPPDLRIRTHLAFAEARLRARDVSELAPDLRVARTRTLDHLRTYWIAGAFPAGESTYGLLPTFVDADGRRCAVAYLVEQTAGEAAMFAIDARHHNAFVAQMDAPELATWATTSGLTSDELALIQPAYPPRPPRFHARLGADYRTQLDAPADAVHTASIRGSARMILPHNRWIGGALASLDGGLGPSSGGLAYDAHLRLGTGFAPMWTWLFHAGITAGLGVDRIGDAVPRTWTAPIEAFWYVQTSERTRLGLLGGPTLVLDGDRARGWNAALDFVVTRDYEGPGALAPRAIHVGLTAQELGEARFVGVALSVATRSVLGYIPW